MSEQGDDFKEYKQSMIKDATVWFGKYKNKRILECYDPEYWAWVWNTEDLYSKMGKYQKKAVRIASQDDTTMRKKIICTPSYWAEAMEPFFQGLMKEDELRTLQDGLANQIASTIRFAYNKTDLKLELLDFLMANNWLNLENRTNAEGVVDAYLDAFKGIDSEGKANDLINEIRSAVGKIKTDEPTDLSKK